MKVCMTKGGLTVCVELNAIRVVNLVFGICIVLHLLRCNVSAQTIYRFSFITNILMRLHCVMIGIDWLIIHSFDIGFSFHSFSK